jgi:hypothetical protein
MATRHQRGDEHLAGTVWCGQGHDHRVGVRVLDVHGVLLSVAGEEGEDLPAAACGGGGEGGRGFILPYSCTDRTDKRGFCQLCQYLSRAIFGKLVLQTVKVAHGYIAFGLTSYTVAVRPSV